MTHLATWRSLFRMRSSSNPFLAASTLKNEINRFKKKGFYSNIIKRCNTQLHNIVLGRRWNELVLLDDGDLTSTYSFLILFNFKCLVLTCNEGYLEIIFNRALMYPSKIYHSTKNICFQKIGLEPLTMNIFRLKMPHFTLESNRFGPKKTFKNRLILQKQSFKSLKDRLGNQKCWKIKCS